MEGVLFTQPGMRYCQAQALVYSLTKDPVFFELSESEKNMVSERILEEVRGRMMEEIVLLEATKAAGKKKRIFKLRHAGAEFDMVIFDAKTNSCECFEIKHSSKITLQQARHLMDEGWLRDTEKRFGTITKRCVLYRGENADLENGIIYRNVEEYLNSLSYNG